MSEIQPYTPPPGAGKGPRAGQWKRLLLSFAAGAAYGLFVRLVFGLEWGEGKKVMEVMAVSFLFLVPFSLGFLTVFLGEWDGDRWSWVKWLIHPWIPAMLALAGALALAWEGIICIALWLPLVLIMSSLGGLAAGLVRRFRRSRRGDGAVLLCIAALPFAAVPIENQLAALRQVRLVETSIEIEASPRTVWRQIERVPEIRQAEHVDFAFSHLLGFPRPVEATLSREGVGGVRHATFEGGVLFVETITRWEPEKVLTFTIEADPDTIPAGTLDEHVTVGGPYFDVLQGEYRLEPLGPNRTLLHLSSEHRLSTRFNFYSGLWTDFLMRDTQEYILRIVKRRCEKS